VYWPLIGGFIAFLIVAVLIGWVIERSERRDAGRSG
jgi:biotin transporter BioY